MELDRKKVKDLVKGLKVQGDEGLQALMKTLAHDVIEVMLEKEMNSHLGYEKNSSDGNNSGNSRNGHSEKKVKSSYGSMDLKTPRDRNSTFSPELVKERQKDISGIESKVVSMYARGMSTRDISDQIDDMYGFKLSGDSISAMTDKVMATAREWQERPLEALYPIVFMDGIVFKVRRDGVVQKVTVYVIIA